MKILKTTIVVAAVAMTTIIQTAKADFVNVGAAGNGGQTTTLAALEASANNGLVIGDKEFSDFTSLATALYGGTGDPSLITVTAIQNGPNSYQLEWEGDVAEVVAGTPAITGDLTLTYTVTATDGKIFAIDQSYTGTSGANPGTTLAVNETAAAPGGSPSVTSDLNAIITSTSYTATGAILDPGQTVLDVTKDISLNAGTTPGNFLDISVVEQSFDEVPVPEASTVLAGALLLLPLGASTLRILRKNRIS